MNGYLLDTNIPSELSRPQPLARLKHWIASAESLHLSAISVGEFRRGCYLLPQGRRRVELERWLTEYLVGWRSDRILPVDAQIATCWGELSAIRQRIGHPLSVQDGLIAATALVHGLILVTRNTKDFTNLDLRMFNPWEQTGDPEWV